MDERLQEESVNQFRVGEACLASPRSRLFRLSGDDRESWLQGQITQDVVRLAIGEAAGFCLVKATGQIEGLGTVAKAPDHLLLAVEDPSAEALLKRVEEMIILEDVTCDEIATDWQFGLTNGLGETSLVEKPSRIVIPNARFGPSSALVWVDPTHESLPQPLPESALDLVEILICAPRVGFEITDKTLPAELGEGFLSRFVSFEKGCYLGQEVLMRMHARGHPNWAVIGLSHAKPLVQGQNLYRGQDVVGQICRCVEWTGGNHISTARIRASAVDAQEPFFSEPDDQGASATVRLPGSLAIS